MADRDATPGTAPKPTAPAGPPAIVHSGESQWTLIWREFRKRRLAVVSMAAIVFLVTVCVFAPFLANDRPIRYQGYNRFEYRECQRTLSAVLESLARAATRATETAATKAAASDKPGESKAKPPDPAALAEIAERQFERMGEHLSDAQSAALAELAGRLPALARDVASADEATRTEAAAAIRALRAEIQAKFDSRKVEYQARVHWPVFAALDWADVALIGFDVALLLVPIWLPLLRRIVPPESPNGRTLGGMLLLAGLPLLAGLGWKLTVPERIDRTPYKRGVLSDAPAAEIAQAPVVFDAVTWPAIPYALDEGKLDRKYAIPAMYAKIPEAAQPSWLHPVSKDDPNAPKLPVAEPGPWDGAHWLGTDEIGRDLFSRMIWGGRVSLAVGIVATLIELVLGIVFGAVAGYFRGWVDTLISRLIEIVICFPSFFLILTIVAFLGPSIFNIMLVIGLTGWTGVARLVRGEFLRLADQEFVLAARSLGYTPARIIFRHVLPNAMAPVLVTATFAIAGAILIESGLSFLGFGITVPKPSWGGILSSGRDAMDRAPWIILFPGLALFVTITAYNLVGEALRDAADPRLRGRT